MNSTAWVCLVVALFNAASAGACLTAAFVRQAGLNTALFLMNLGLCVWNVTIMVEAIGR